MIPNVFIRIRVFILYHNVEYYKITIDDTQNEMNFFYHCNMFEYIHHIEQVF